MPTNPQPQPDAEAISMQNDIKLPSPDAEGRLWDFVNQTFSGTTTGPRTDAIEQSLRDHERAGLVVSRKDLRALLASLATLRGENATLGHLSAKYAEIADTHRRERDEARDKFRRYADHRSECETYRTTRCDCGFADAWYATFPEDKPFADAARAPQGRTG